MTMTTDVIMVALITGTFGFLGNWVLNNKTLAVLQEKMEQLEKKQDKHNQLIERVYKLEADVENIKKELE